jgi:hypothetical protein
MAAFNGLAVAVRETRREPATLVQVSSRGAMDWNDVRVFLAVAREGSMRAAGRAPGLSQPTIARRLAAFEASFGGPALFVGFMSSFPRKRECRGKRRTARCWHTGTS